jgi:hypothetical protein
VIEAMRREKETNGYEFPDKWESIARRNVQTRLYRVGVKDGPSWVIRVDAKKYPIYARSASVAAKWEHADADMRRREILRNGDPGNVRSISEALAKLQVVGGTASGGR